MTVRGRAWLFVPADRPDRFPKAVESGADEIILDLEDALRPAAKDTGRGSSSRLPTRQWKVWVRINAPGTSWHDDDVAAMWDASPAGVVIPKCESVDAVAHLAERLRPQVEVIALIESAAGIDAAGSIANHPRVKRLAFGSLDFAFDIEAQHTSEALLFARSQLVIASRVAEITAPLDGVTATLTWRQRWTTQDERARSEWAANCAFTRPRSNPCASGSVQPERKSTRHAASSRLRRIVRKVLVALDGRMVDRPVLERARRILAEADS